MNKTDIIQLVEDIANVPLDADTIDIYYDDVLDTLGRSSFAPLVDGKLFAITSGTAVYSAPSDKSQILDIFIGSRHLSSSTLFDLEAYDDSWRTLTGSPLFYVMDEQNNDDFQLVPSPTTSSGNFSFPNGLPLGTDFPSGAGYIFYSYRRDSDIPSFLGIYIALHILIREFTRPSDHQDFNFADACLKTTTIFEKALGI